MVGEWRGEKGVSETGINPGSPGSQSSKAVLRSVPLGKQGTAPCMALVPSAASPEPTSDGSCSCKGQFHEGSDASG